MKLIKSSFYIQNIPAAPLQFVEQNGYIMGLVGFHKDGSRWIATDIPSGMRICKKLTRKECVEFCERYKGKIAAAKGSAQYHRALRNMVEFKEKLKMGL